MKFYHRKGLENSYCLYLTADEAVRLVDSTDPAVVWNMRKLLMNQFEREEKRGLPPVSDRTDP